MFPTFEWNAYVEKRVGRRSSPSSARSSPSSSAAIVSVMTSSRQAASVEMAWRNYGSSSQASVKQNAWLISAPLGRVETRLNLTFCSCSSRYRQRAGYAVRGETLGGAADGSVAHDVGRADIVNDNVRPPRI